VTTTRQDQSATATEKGTGIEIGIATETATPTAIVTDIATTVATDRGELLRTSINTASVLQGRITSETRVRSKV
jgi:acyl-CoA hydrolase